MVPLGELRHDGLAVTRERTAHAVLLNIVGGHAGFEVLAHLLASGEAQGVPVKGAVLVDTGLVVVGIAQAEGALVRGAHDAHVVGEGHTRLEELVDVVRGGLPGAHLAETSVSLVVIPAVPVADGRAVQSGTPASIEGVVRDEVAVNGVGPSLARSTTIAVLVGRENVDVVEGHTAVHADAEAALAAGLVAFAGLGRDDDGAVRGAGTIKGRGSRTFQDGHRLDVIRVEVLDGVSVVVSTHGALLVSAGVVRVVHRHTVHHEERLVVAGNGAGTTKEHLGGRSDCRARRHLDTSNLTGEGAHDILGLGIREGVIAQLLHGVAQRFLLTAYTEGGHDDFVQCHAALHRNVYGSTGHFLPDCIVSDEAVDQDVASRSADIVHAIHVRDDSGVGAFDDHRHSGQGFARLGIRHLTGHALGEGRGGHQAPSCRKQE